MTNLLKIEDGTLRMMIDDHRFVGLLPCLSGAKKTLDAIAPGGEDCKKCERVKRQKYSTAMQTAKQCIKNARGQRLYQLKQLLGASQLRLVVTVSNGRSVTYTL